MAIIHKFELNGLKMVLDANSGSFHIVDDLIYDIIDYYKKVDEHHLVNLLKDKYNGAQIIEGLTELKELEDMGLLYTEDPYENIEHKAEEKNYIKAMCLNIAHDCNLRCKYCFASEGGYNGRRSLMSFDVGKAAIDFVIKESGPRRNIEVDLFGGEPLMNFNTVKSIVDYGLEQGIMHGKTIRFTMTTNATLLNDDIMEYLDKNMGNIVLSIDGRKSVNDGVRVRVDGRGTFDDILPKIKRMVDRRKEGKQYYVRGTFTSKNLDFCNDVLELVNQGFDEISIEPVVLEEGSELSLKEEHLDIIFDQYDKIANEVLRREKEGRTFKFYHFNIDINGGPCIYKRISGCGAGFEYIAVTPEGDIYPCHQFVGNENYRMGSVFDGKINKDICGEFKNANLYNKPGCKECWAKFYCSGGCQANNYNFNGDILKPYELGCKLQKKRIECALMINAVRRQNDEKNECTIE